MATQIIYRNGNSAAVTIPKEYLEELNLQIGSTVVVKKKGKEVVITPKDSQLASDVDSKFAKMVDEFINRHEDGLQELSKR